MRSIWLDPEGMTWRRRALAKVACAVHVIDFLSAQLARRVLLMRRAWPVPPVHQRLVRCRMSRLGSDDQRARRGDRLRAAVRAFSPDPTSDRRLTRGASPLSGPALCSVRHSGIGNASAGRSGRGQRRHADEGSDCNGDCPDDREHELPGFRGHGVLHDAMRRVKARDGRWRNES